MAKVDDVIDRVIRRLNELSTSSPVHWSRSEILQWVNDGINELNLLSGELQRDETVTLTAGNNFFSLAADAIAPLSIQVGDKYLFRESIGNLDNESIDWESSGAVGNTPGTWCPFGLTQLLVYKRVSASTNVEVTEFCKHTNVTDSATDVPLREEYMSCVEDYAVSRAFFKEGGPEFEQGLLAYNRFLDVSQELTGRNILRRYPAWSIVIARTAPVTPREKAQELSGDM